MLYIRKVVAVVGQLVALLLILAFTAYSGFYAWSWAKTIRFVSDQLLRGAAEMKRANLLPEVTTPENLQAIVNVSNLSEPNAWLIIGAVIGFLISAAVLSIIFMLADIMHNTRRTVAFFEHLQNARSDQKNSP